MASLNIPPEKMATYRAAAREREERRREAVARRRARAWEVARAGAARLRDAFGATRVVVFGSLTGASTFHERSDIDVAAWGVAHGDYLDALGVLMEIDPAFEIDFVRVEEVSAAFRDRIQAEGVEP